MKRTERVLSTVLNILALINIELLFLDLITIGPDQLQIYNRFAITILLIHIAVEFIRNGFTLARLRDFIPDLLFIGIGLFVVDSDRVFEFYLLGRQAFIFIRNLALREEKGRLFEKLSDNPPILVLISFFIAIFLGTLMLLLPIATVAGRETSVIDALFTSTSATCVTGLIVQDTGTHFTLWGQIIIAFLIQIGGLGIMTVSSAFAIILGQRMTVKSESMIQNVIGESSKIDMINLVKNIVIVTFTFELIGAIMFFYTFHSRLPSVNMAIFHSIFHSISSFCNAGFCLYTDSMTAYRSNFNINFVVTSLIILGGIGFPVMVDIRRNLSGKFRLQRLSLHSKIVLTTTLILIVVGAVCFFITEYNSEMKGFRFSERLYSSYFQSVTTRTAGFNTIDNANLSKASILVSVLLMFIGASPGSTAGGIKTTALMIIMVSVIAMIKGNREVNIFKRQVSDQIIKRVMALITATITLLSLFIFLLLLIEPFAFERILFEAVSAYGTVGLSMGITPDLTGAGKLIIVCLMYLGRVGPLTLIFAISATQMKSYYHYTEEKITIG